ncbi:MAG: hypothetical protein KF901_34175 [Myxococcales bacterium]|nr:hypothetical protein [Myxococcales bacterium]
MTDSKEPAATPWAGFLGTWTYDPTRAVYEVGGAPLAATYRVEAGERDGAPVLRFAMDWTSAEGEALSLSLEAPPDGLAHPLDGPNVDALVLRCVDARTLETDALHAGIVRAHVRRTLSADGRELHIVQQFTTDEELLLVNESYYTRVD